MSEVKVNKITPTANCGTVTLGDSGDTVAIPAGVTLTSGGALQNSGTITNTGTITGVAITGTIDNQVNWQTTVKTTGFTATAGEGYFCDTTSAAFTVTLPASPSAGDLVGIKDYANTADTNNITIGRNGSNIEGVANDFVIEVEGGSITLIYVDATKGWLSTAAAKASDISEQQLFTVATGGTITTSGDFKIHTFTGPGTFTVSQVGNCVGGPGTVDYLTIAGGGSGGNYGARGGGGAGGYRESSGAASGCYTVSPLGACVSALPVAVQGYPITVGGGGTVTPNQTLGGKGSNSIFSTITSAGGGAGFACNPGSSFDGDGGSGGAGSFSAAVGAGNTPPVSPPQGNPGGLGAAYPALTASGGGGAGATGGGGTPSAGGTGGAGVTSNITNTPTQRAGGGGGGVYTPNTRGGGGAGGGGQGADGPSPGSAGTANTGGGGGGAGSTPSTLQNNGGNGGSGIIVIRYKFQ